MKNLLILIVAAAVYLHFYPQPQLEKKYQETKESIVDNFSEITSTTIKLKASKIYDDLSGDFSNFSSDEINHLKEITLTRQAVKKFYRNNCSGAQPERSGNGVFQQENLKKVCSTINNYKSRM